MADQASEGLLSPYLREKRIQAVRPYLKGRVLDVGCGSGALARLLAPGNYLGVDRDSASLQRARATFPIYAFASELPESEGQFDTVVSMAVIEHLSDPVEHLRSLSQHLKKGREARIVLTTPHPAVDWVHDIGARVGLFSRHANDEHEELLDRARLLSVGASAGLVLSVYERFLFGANQLAIYSREHS
ncbi:class I SAM-dependent methyltransferase [Pseudomonas citronellolis]|uniref:class I SAM-dependent methyltransferase n=1 Tax=Pseudomonas citronellolis TaxID=53408 RepID=UPI0023E3F6E7|nr:class I SAM-dependent methyltransferase [Pseudomonas citronellolis]MDF3931720.1 class I SAM-dependent methyltransferase [Pseudomonas citronellolis]